MHGASLLLRGLRRLRLLTFCFLLLRGLGLLLAHLRGGWSSHGILRSETLAGSTLRSHAIGLVILPLTALHRDDDHAKLFIRHVHVRLTGAKLCHLLRCNLHDVRRKVLHSGGYIGHAHATGKHLTLLLLARLLLLALLLLLSQLRGLLAVLEGLWLTLLLTLLLLLLSLHLLLLLLG